MAKALDIFIAYKFIRQLSTPWKEWEAFKLGLIDKDGKKLKKARTPEELTAFPKWMIMVRNIKRFLEKLPFGKTRLGSFAASLFLLKEEMGAESIEPMEDEFRNYIGEEEMLLESEDIDKNINIPRGRWRHIETDDIIFLREEAVSLYTAFGYPIFQITDDLTKKQYTIIRKDLEPF